MSRQGQLVCADISDLERDVIDQMKVAAGVASDANLLRIALWNLADHLGIDPPNTVFDQRFKQPPQMRRKAAS